MLSLSSRGTDGPICMSPKHQPVFVVTLQIHDFRVSIRHIFSYTVDCIYHFIRGTTVQAVRLSLFKEERTIDFVFLFTYFPEPQDSCCLI